MGLDGLTKQITNEELKKVLEIYLSTRFGMQASISEVAVFGANESNVVTYYPTLRIAFDLDPSQQIQKIESFDGLKVLEAGKQ